MTAYIYTSTPVQDLFYLFIYLTGTVYIN